jgi:phospholipase/lecithinase/hemolysin
MTPTEFALWLNGALGVMDDQPTPEQMAKIREKLGETIGQLTADRLLERAEEAARLDRTRRDREKELYSLKEQMAKQAAKHLDEMAYRTLYGTTTSVAYDEHVQQFQTKIDEFNATVRSALPGEIVPMPGAPKVPGALGSLLRPAVKVVAK